MSAPTDDAPTPPTAAVAAGTTRSCRSRRATRSSRCSRSCSRCSSAAIMIAFTDEDVQAAAGYFFARPGDTLVAIWDAVVGRLHRALPGLGLQLRRADLRARHPPAHRDAHLRDAADRRRARRRARVPHRHVQHRRPRSDAHGVRGGRLGGVLARPAVGHPHDRRPRRGHRRRRALGGHRRAAQGAHRRARGDRDDHAQLRRVLPRLVDAAHPGPAAGAGVEQPQDAADARTRRSSRSCSGRSSTCTSASSSSIARDRPGVVDPQPLEPRLPVPRGRREPQRRARRGHQRQEHVRLRHADLRRPRSASPA